MEREIRRVRKHCFDREVMLTYVLYEIDEAVTCCLRADVASSPIPALPCQHAYKLVLEPLVCAK